MINGLAVLQDRLLESSPEKIQESPTKLEIRVSYFKEF
jgi:hypothetical protein